MINLLTICDGITSNKEENTITLHIDRNYLLPSYDLTIIGFSVEEMIEFYEDEKGLPNGIVEVLPKDMIQQVSESIAEMINQEIDDQFLEEEYYFESLEYNLEKIKELFLMQTEHEGNEIEIFYKSSPRSIVYKEKAHMDEDTEILFRFSEQVYIQVQPELIVEYLGGKEND